MAVEHPIASVRFSAVVGLVNLVAGLALGAATMMASSWSVFEMLFALIAIVLAARGLTPLSQRALIVMPREVIVNNMLGIALRRYPYERAGDLLATSDALHVAGVRVQLATSFSSISDADWQAMVRELRAYARESDQRDDENEDDDE